MIQTYEIQNNMNITFTTTGVNAKSIKHEPEEKAFLPEEMLKW